MKNVIRTCALGVGLAAMFAASSFATTFQSEKVSIPFQFRVSRTTMPAGEYKLRQSAGSGIAFLVNVKTGQQVQVLRSPSSTENKARLVFETNAEGYKLKTIW